MAHEIKWYIPDRLYFIRMAGKLTIEDILHITEDAQVIVELYRERPVHPHCIADIRGMEGIAFNLSEIRDSLSVFRGNNFLHGWVLIVGEVNPVTRMILSVIAQTFRFRFRLFTELTPALAFLMENDPALPPVQPIPAAFAQPYTSP